MATYENPGNCKKAVAGVPNGKVHATAAGDLFIRQLVAPPGLLLRTPAGTCRIEPVNTVLREKETTCERSKTKNAGQQINEGDPSKRGVHKLHEKRDNELKAGRGRRGASGPKN